MSDFVIVQEPDRSAAGEQITRITHPATGLCIRFTTGGEGAQYERAYAFMLDRVTARLRDAVAHHPLTTAPAKRKRRAVRNLRNALHGAHGPTTQQRVTDALDAFLIRRTSLPNDPPTR